MYRKYFTLNTNVSFLSLVYIVVLLLGFCEIKLKHFYKIIIIISLAQIISLVINEIWYLMYNNWATNTGCLRKCNE